MKIAHVGCTKPMTTFDQCIRAMALAEVCRLGLQLDRWPDHDTINLEQGRDFLQETEKYEGVILYSIFHTQPRYHTPETKLKMGNSPDHTIEKWRERLEGCQANWIVVVEAAPFSLSGWHLRDLAGYQRIDRGRVTIYSKEKIHGRIQSDSKQEVSDSEKA